MSLAPLFFSAYNGAMPAISVIIPTYNRAYVLARAVNSLRAQTLSDWELIIVDDGSGDNTHETVTGFNDARIRYLHQTNAGPSAARNHGLAHAKSDMIAYLDSDDAFYPAYLERVLKSSAHYGTCKQKRTLVFLNADGSIRCEKTDPNNEDGPVTLQDFYDWRVKTTSSGLFHRRDLKARWRDVMIEDLDFILQLAVLDPEGFAYLPQTLVDYRQSYNGDGLCSKATYGLYAQAFGQIYEWHKNDPMMKNPHVYLDRVKGYADKQARMDAGRELPPIYKYFPELWDTAA